MQSATPTRRRPFLTSKEAAAYLKRSRRALYRIVENPDSGIPFKKLGPHQNAQLLFDPEELDAWMAANGSGPVA